MLLAPMCSTPLASCSRTQIAAVTQLGCFSSGVRRKQGVCLITNPVLQVCQDQEQLSARSSTGLKQFNQSVSRPACEFVTFKGPASTQNHKEAKLNQEPESKAMTVPTDEDRARYGSVRKGSCGNFKERMTARDAFETVDLDEKERGTGKEKVANNCMQQLGATDLPPANGMIDLMESVKTYEDDAKEPFPYAGIIGTLVSSTFFSLSVFCVKLLPDSDSFQEKVKAVWFRGIFFTVMSAITMIAQGTTFKIKRKEIGLNVARTCIGFFGVFGAYTSLQYITLGESTALIYLSIVWTAILGYTILKEPFPKTLIFAIPMAMFGIIMIAHPGLILGKSVVEEEILTEAVRHKHTRMINHTIVGAGQFNLSTTAATHLLYPRSIEIIANTSSNEISPTDDFIGVDPDVKTKQYFEQRWLGILIATATSSVISIVFIILKHRRSTPIQTTTFYLGVGTILMSTTIQCFVGFGRWPKKFNEWLPLLCMGTLSWCGQGLMQWSLQYEKASVLGVVKTVDLVLAFCWGTFFLDEDILWTSVVGASIILVIVVVLVLNDRVEKLFCSKCTSKK